MKKIFAFVLSLILALSVLAGPIAPPKGFEGKVWNSTLALYATLQTPNRTVTHFDCTAEPIEKIPGGYLLMSAGHCVQEIPDHMQFSVAEEISGPRTNVKLVKAYEGDGIDFAVFTLKTTKTYPIFAMDFHSDVRIGDKIVIGNFTEGVAKQLSRGVVASQIIPKSEDCKSAETCADHFMVQAYGGPGASGSAVISVRTHKIIGLAVYGFDGTLGFGVEPISRFNTFTLGPNQPHPAEDEEASPLSPAATSLTISADVFAAQFGEAHPFTLTVKGPNPTFTQAGYTFQVDILGNELSDEYYYDVPVFIAHDADGYRLVSTKDGYSVGVIVLGAAK